MKEAFHDWMASHGDLSKLRRLDMHLTVLSLFAVQHSMYWICGGVWPSFPSRLFTMFWYRSSGLLMLSQLPCCFECRKNTLLIRADCNTLLKERIFCEDGRYYKVVLLSLNFVDFTASKIWQNFDPVKVCNITRTITIMCITVSSHRV